MSIETSQLNNIRWPQYFQPRDGQEHALVDEQLRLPVNFVDVFYLQKTKGAPTELVAVVGCIGGDLEVVTGEALSTLPDDLQDQLQTVQINSRSRFRAICAEELYVSTLDAVEQEVEAAGFNDAVYLYARMQAKLSYSYNGVQTTPLSSEGKITVGRLDLLHAFRQSQTHSFQNPKVASEHMHQLIVPVASVGEIEQGHGVALIYPLLDPGMFTRVDNSAIVKRIVYDLLSRLQQDMIQEEVMHSFGKMNLPVPSRFRLESDLSIAGYKIVGDIAIQEVKPQQDVQGRTRFLDQLRRTAKQWFAKKIQLPPEANLGDYTIIIQSVLDAVVTNEDAAMMKALSDRVEGRVSPVESEPAPEIKPAKRRAPKKHIETSKSQTTPRAGKAQVLPVGSRPTITDRSAEWASDFAKPVTALKPERDTKEWWRDFGGEDQVAEHKRIITTISDWEADFLAQEGIVPVATASRPVDELTGDGGWEQDFQQKEKPQKLAPDSSAQDWEDDFK